MPYTHEWKINYMDTKLSQDGLEKVVVSCQWSINSFDTEDPKIRASNYGYCTFSEPDADNFLAYTDLSEETVLEWIWANGVDKQNVEEGMVSTIEIQRNPPTVILGNPWNANASPSATTTVVGEAQQNTSSSANN